ncbi:MAG: FHA domain-containing protein, partial [Planctomycetes bacterium]|nr:FHA domain-containing protein [Planctomycetota bacterium]
MAVDMGWRCYPSVRAKSPHPSYDVQAGRRLTGYLSLPDGRSIPLHDDFIVGRGSGCDLVIDDSKASRRHARFVVEGGVVEIEDLNSSNGTLLNGKPVARRLVRPGDQLQIGKTVMIFSAGQPAASAVSAAAPAAAVFDDDDELFGEAPIAAA